MTDLRQTCECGKLASEANVYARGIYRRHDRVLLSLGATRRPIKVEIRCTRCQHVFAVTDDASLRERTCARDWVTPADLVAATTSAAA
ncbi:MAG: hypothetical protein ACOY5B_14310 [Spirochaetota bacterium]